MISRADCWVLMKKIIYRTLSSGKWSLCSISDYGEVKHKGVTLVENTFLNSVNFVISNTSQNCFPYLALLKYTTFSTD